ncbi:hypothetical protein Cgig2_014594 [Carnegiea gigantea]|uniref:Amino acid transporter transmembrane domain-containing protein n=1 Tax=Carnegiea gigantea TaxID=171969 RepID=A0A9Q1KXV7_9CARY|nr:hypothetical protein Cgig2_014594 [Carnegiea gigantea]
MKKDYSALPQEKLVELRSQDGNFDDKYSSKIPASSEPISLKLFPVHGDSKSSNGIIGPYDDDNDNDHPGLDDHPLIMGGTGGGGIGSGVPGAVFNLATSIIGAGIMALPATMKVLGLVAGLILIAIMGALSEVSVELLIRFAVQCNAMSYGEVVQHALGRPARIISEICIIVNNAGILVVYLIIIGDVMSGSPHHSGVFDQVLGTGLWDHRKLVILAVLVILLAPLCTFDRIESLSLSSAASVVLAVIFVVVTCVVAFTKLAEGRIDPPRMTPDFSSKRAIMDLLVVIPIMANAYVCHFNVQPIYNELEGRSTQKMNRVGRITTVICVVVYAFTAFSGYLLFGSNTESDILTNFDTNLGIRYSTALDYIVRIESPPLIESRARLLGLTMALLALIYLGSTMIPNIWTAFKFTGATTAVSLGFIFPALIALRLDGRGESLTAGEKLFSWVMLVFAIVVGIVGVVGNVYGLKSQSG